MKKTISELETILKYDPVTGNLLWLLPSVGRIRQNKIAGTLDTQGYMNIKHDGYRYKCHRIAYGLMTGDWPKGQIDHINGVVADNRWSNLRVASGQENAQNSKTRTDNKSGHKNVYWCNTYQKWVARIKDKSGKKHTRYCKSLEEAIQQAHKLRITHHGEFANHG